MCYNPDMTSKPDLRVRVRQALPGESDQYFTESARIRALEDLAEREHEADARKKRMEEEDQTIPGLKVLHG
jgi:hypothetical protein